MRATFKNFNSESVNNSSSLPAHRKALLTTVTLCFSLRGYLGLNAPYDLIDCNIITCNPRRRMRTSLYTTTSGPGCAFSVSVCQGQSFPQEWQRLLHFQCLTSIKTIQVIQKLFFSFYLHPKISVGRYKIPIDIHRGSKYSRLFISMSISKYPNICHCGYPYNPQMTKDRPAGGSSIQQPTKWTIMRRYLYPNLL